MTLIERDDNPWRPGGPMPSSPHEDPEQVASYVDAERRHGVNTALRLILEGKPGRARYELQRSVQRQARIAGLGTLPVVSTCRCLGCLRGETR